MHVSATRCIVYKRMCIFHELPVSHATTIKKISPSLLLWKQSSCLFVMCAVFPFLYHFPIHLSPFIAYFPSSLTFFPELCVCVCVHQMEGCLEADSMMTTSAANRIIGSCWWA